MTDKKTLGQMMWETQAEHAKMADAPIESGNLVEEMGNKEIMKEIWKQIHARDGLPEWREKYYIMLYIKKNAILNRVIEAFVQCRHTEPTREWSLTCFSYDPLKRDKGLKLEWVLPHKRAYRNMLQNREKYDPFLIQCIEVHLQELKRKK